MFGRAGQERVSSGVATPGSSTVGPMLDLPGLQADVEDPVFDGSNGHLFVLSGNESKIYEINPVNGTFGDVDDVLVVPAVG